MKKTTFIAILALLVAAAGTIVALLAYFGKKKCVLCNDFDDFDDDFMSEDTGDVEYYSTDLTEEPSDEAAESTETEDKADKEDEK